MESPTTTTAAPGADHPQEQRTCAYCNAIRIVTPETWPYRKKGRNSNYAAHGARCLECDKKRKQAYESRRDKIKAVVNAPLPEPDKSGKRRDRIDVATALKAGAHVLNEQAASVLSRVLEYAEDPESEHHIWALELLAQRILPRKLFEELGGQAAGVGALSNRPPQFVLNITTTPGGASGVVHENEVLVQALPAPEEESDAG